MAARGGKPPVVGAALTIGDLERLHNWVLDAGRDLELQEFCYAEILNADWRPLVDRYRRLLDGHKGRVGIHGPFWGFDIGTRDPDVRALVQKKMMQGLDVCEALAMPGLHMVVHSPFTIWDHNNYGHLDGEYERLIKRCVKTMKDVVKRAHDIGCEIVIENIEDIDPRYRLELVKAFESPAVKLSLDTGHAYYCQMAQGAPPVDYFVKAAGKLLAHVHLQDADGHADRHWAPGEGTILWKPVFEAIARHCDNPRLILELDDRTKLVQGQEFLAKAGLAA
jgi:sugar phosphate isomerase/epimerase